MVNIEIEYKVMVNKDDFCLLLEKFIGCPYKLFIQTNYYYDTKDNLVNKNKLSLRIRNIENNNSFILTLKEKQKNVNKEYENIVSSINDFNFSKEAMEVLNKYKIKQEDLYLTGSLKTYRLEFIYKGGLLCFDYNLYNNIKDFEIEFESYDITHATETVNSLLDKYNVKYEKSPLSKQARALNKKG